METCHPFWCAAQRNVFRFAATASHRPAALCRTSGRPTSFQCIAFAIIALLAIFAQSSIYVKPLFTLMGSKSFTGCYTNHRLSEPEGPMIFMEMRAVTGRKYLPGRRCRCRFRLKSASSRCSCPRRGDHVGSLVPARSEGVGVFEVDVSLSKYLKDIGKGARLVGNLDGEHRRHRQCCPRFEHPLRFIRIADDRAERRSRRPPRATARMSMPLARRSSTNSASFPGLFSTKTEICLTVMVFSPSYLIPPSIIINFLYIPMDNLIFYLTRSD